MKSTSFQFNCIKQTAKGKIYATDIKGEKAVYHIISRTALAGLPFGDVEKDEFVKILKGQGLGSNLDL